MALVDSKFHKLLEEVREYDSKSDSLKGLSHAYEFACRVHTGQKRKSGEPYIIHPVEVACILAEMKMDSATLQAGLLHDVLEDSSVKVGELEKEFGEEVASLVEGVTKLSLPSRTRASAENLRRMLLTMARDIRVIVVKLADRLHNMRTLEFLSQRKADEVARETLDIYAPLAYRLGIASLKWELEDRAFKQLYPELYEDFKKRIHEGRAEREEKLEEARKILASGLRNAKIKARITGRPKHFYSIYQKMKKLGASFSEIYDLLALRVITSSVRDCYGVLGVLHTVWKPIPGAFDDYIATPKENFYQSLHTVVATPFGRIEVQIRTLEMDKIAEEGIAAHWRYKGIFTEEEFDRKLTWVKDILEFKKRGQELRQFLKVDLFADKIFVFTPKGDVIELPQGSTTVDFAYAIHTNLGDRASGAHVNGKFVPLKTELKSGDTVEVITSPRKNPSRDWLKFVRTSKAKDKIRAAIREAGGIPSKSYSFQKPRHSLEESLVEVAAFDVRLAKCCSPLPEDEIVAFVGESGKAIVHKSDCSAVDRLERGPKKKVAANWKKDVKQNVEITVEALDRVGLFAQIMGAVASTKTNVEKTNAKVVSNMTECSFTIKSRGLEHLREIIDKIKRIKEVKKVEVDVRKK